MALIIAPVLFAASTFFWVNGEYGIAAATFGIISLFFWIPALTGLFSLLKNKMPRYATYGLWIAVFGCISGVCFMFLGYLTTIFNISHSAYLQKLSEYPFSSQLLLFATGPLFPLSLLILGIILFRTKTVAAWIAILLCLGAIAFPASRIPRVEWIAHVADVLLLVPTMAIGFSLLKNSKTAIQEKKSNLANDKI
ncbi:hypothetical protein FRZ67_12900 [Panacibacter ginsenosidivorans]|uniref:Uncharacterized protein n=1 Tax=Panacibacter ginsenosidivorans TaxID=1813871 RepID=A0A5B8VB02_9BACT|nr:hypothetical protein [Panacibacter ginsenosidivorans]QEC68153.1 hypothetical protein FRZ67_12900 [Panacibacter ginsenosidivorans]